MNWEAVSAIGELVGSVGVLITLIYLALQIRQNTESLESNKQFARAQIYQARSDAVMKLQGEYTESAIWSKLIDEEKQLLDYDKLDELTIEEKLRLGQFAAILDTHADNIEVQRSLGLMAVDNDALAAHNQSYEILYELSRRLGRKLRPTTKKMLNDAGYDVSLL